MLIKKECMIQEKCRRGRLTKDLYVVNLYASTLRNGQTHLHNLLAENVWECLTILWGWHLKDYYAFSRTSHWKSLHDFNDFYVKIMSELNNIFDWYSHWFISFKSFFSSISECFPFIALGKACNIKDIRGLSWMSHNVSFCSFL